MLSNELAELEGALSAERAECARQEAASRAAIGGLGAALSDARADAEAARAELSEGRREAADAREAAAELAVENARLTAHAEDVERRRDLM